MKKMIIILMVIALLFTSAIAEPSSAFTDYMTSKGIEYNEITADGEMFTEENLKNFTEHGDAILFADVGYFQMLLWYDGDKPYGTSSLMTENGVDTQSLADVFVEGLNGYVWDACSYSVQSVNGDSVTLNYAPGYENADEGATYYDDFESYMEAVTASMSGAASTSGAAPSSPVLDYVRNTLNLTPETMDQKFNLDSLNLLVSTGGDPVITWTDSANSIAYAITVPQADMLEAYTDMIFLSHWDTCGLFIDNERVLVYDHTENGTKESAATYEEYGDAVAAYFSSEGNEADADPASSERDYVLNTNSKKFHLASCASVDQIKSKNRQDYHGTRDDLIARGYEPCGSCNP